MLYKNTAGASTSDRLVQEDFESREGRATWRRKIVEGSFNAFWHRKELSPAWQSSQRLASTPSNGFRARAKAMMV